MSHTQTPPPAGQTSTPPATYSYGTYPYSYPQTPGTYSYPGTYQAGVTSYGWPYPYSYVQQGAVPQVPRAQGSQASVAPYTPTSTSTPQRTTTFTAYAPNYAKESVSSSTTQTGTGRGGRRQANLKGLFTKECKLNFYLKPRKVFIEQVAIPTVKNLMYGFGDDRNPANDAVSVMEEILIEYITDVVCSLSPVNVMCNALKQK